MKKLKPKPQPKQIVEIHIYVHQVQPNIGGQIMPGSYPNTIPTANPYYPTVTC